jgi:hypothetical protein
MPASPQPKEARDDLKFWKDQAQNLAESQRGLGAIIAIIDVQKKSGILYIDWPGSERPEDNSRRSHYDQVPDGGSWPALSVDEMIKLLIEVKVNMAICSHPADQREKTGEQIPMGSFTAQPERCQRCGLRFSDD